MQKYCNFLIADFFLNYDDLPMMLMFNIPCVVAVLVIHIKMQKVYLDHYLLTKKLQRLVVHDQLTGMFNRNMLDELSNPDTEELNIPKETAVTVLIADIDFFKKVNDKYGHEGGDIVLKYTAKVIKESVRSTDYVIRWGGEEFVIILVGCKLDRGSEIAEKIRQNVENSDNSICSVTISIGVTEYDGQNYHDTIEKADIALYTAKKEGRNRVIIYNEEN
jgi:diguanylate cyclase (GGDEF)-like protein